MESKGFSIGSLLKRGWHLFREHAAVFIIFLVTALIFGGLAIGLPLGLTGVEPIWKVLIGLAFFILGTVVYIGLFRLALKVVDGKSPSFGDLFGGFSVVIQWIITTFLYALIAASPVIVAGLIASLLNLTQAQVAIAFGVYLVYLAQIPSAILAAMFWPWPFVMIDKTSNPIKALKETYKLTEGAKWDVYLLILASGLVVGIGFILVVVGFFAAFPVTLIAQAGMYRALQAKTPNVS